MESEDTMIETDRRLERRDEKRRALYAFKAAIKSTHMQCYYNTVTHPSLSLSRSLS